MESHILKRAYAMVIWIQTLAGGAHIHIKTYIFFLTRKQEPMRFDRGSMPQQPRALTTWARAARFMTSGTFHLKKSTQGGGAWRRGPAPKAQPHAHKTTPHDQALTNCWRTFWADSDNFDLFANFGKVNFLFPEFSGVFGEKRRKVCYWENRSYR